MCTVVSHPEAQCFSGMDDNSRGEFNVPWGRYKNYSCCLDESHHRFLKAGERQPTKREPEEEPRLMDLQLPFLLSLTRLPSYIQRFQMTVVIISLPPVHNEH